MPTEKLTAFIKEVCLEYSELLYLSYKITMELREVEFVKNCLNERFKKLNKICFQLEAELNEYRTPKKMLSSQSNSMKQENIEELRFTLINKENEINILKSHLEVNSIIFE